MTRSASSRLMTGLLGGATASMLALCALATPAFAATYYTFDVPGAAGVTNPTGVNAHNEVTGWYYDSNQNGHGFIRKANGKITTFDVPGSTSTYPQAIDDAGTVVGFSDGQAFLRTKDGVITTFSMPDGSAASARTIGKKGVIGGDDSTNHGFIRTTDGTITSFKLPHAQNCFEYGINDGGAATGNYYDVSTGMYRGFLYTHNGALKRFQVNGAISTNAYAIANDDTITGYYTDGSFVIHGFLRAKDGTITSLDVPGQNYTNPVAIAPNGAYVAGYSAVVVGFSFTYSGFLRHSDGSFESVVVPGAVNTAANSVNKMGAVAGYYWDSTSGPFHGFLRTL